MTQDAKQSASSTRDAPTTIPGILRNVGPGMILAGSIVGSGELIGATRTGAEAHFDFLWLIIIGCIIKVFAQIELGRYAITNGKTTLAALNEVPGPMIQVEVGQRKMRANWIIWYWVLMFVAILGQQGGIVGGVGQAMAISVPLTEEGKAYNENRRLTTFVKMGEGKRKQLEVKETRKLILDDMEMSLANANETIGTQIDANKTARQEVPILYHLTLSDENGTLFEKSIKAVNFVQKEKTEDWVKQNPVLEKNELGYDEEAKTVKIGDGIKKWDDLPVHLSAVASVNTKIMDAKYWAVILTILAIFLLVWGKFSFIERFSVFLVASFTLITIANLLALQSNPYYGVNMDEFIRGLSFGFPAAEVGKNPLVTALSTFGIIGVGAAELLAYPYWCLEKGYGKYVGKRDDSDAWALRAKGWMKVMHWDAWGAMVVYTFCTIAFYLLGAAVLGRSNLVPGGSEMIQTLSAMYQPVFGVFAQNLFLFGAFAVLFSTFYVAIAAQSRIAVDAAKVSGVADFDESQRQRSLKWMGVVLPILSVLCYVFFPKPVVLVLISGTMQAIMLPMIGFAVLYFRYKKSDKRLQPGKLWDIFLWISFAGFLVVGIYQTLNKLFPHLFK
jgi:Mn2+/Fe2+ NRAMP family transporter